VFFGGHHPQWTVQKGPLQHIACCARYQGVVAISHVQMNSRRCFLLFSFCANRRRLDGHSAAAIFPTKMSWFLDGHFQFYIQFGLWLKSYSIKNVITPKLHLFLALHMWPCPLTTCASHAIRESLEMNCPEWAFPFSLSNSIAIFCPKART
jgi:hypothetical protein